MAGPYYVKSDGNDANTGLSWAQAFLTMDKLIGTGAALGAGEVAYVREATYTIGTNQTWTIPTGAIIQVSDAADTAEPPSILGDKATIGMATAGLTLVINGTGVMSGFIFNVGTSTASASTITCAQTSGNRLEFKNCEFNIKGVNTTSTYIAFGNASDAAGTSVRTNGCIVTFNGAAQHIRLEGEWRTIGDVFALSGTIPSTLVKFYGASQDVRMWNANLAGCGTSTFFNAVAADLSGIVRMYNCKLPTGSSYTMLGTTSIYPELFAWRCAGSDLSYLLHHYSYYGSTVVSSTVYLTTLGATYDGVNRYSFLVSSTANATKAVPYRSPWFNVYKPSTTGSITPYVESLRSGSTTKYKDGEVYSSWSYEGTAGFPLGIHVDDRSANIALDGADQAASSLTAADWTGEDVTNNAFMKLGTTAAINVQYSGHLSFRVCIAKASVTDLYIDPRVRT